MVITEKYVTSFSLKLPLLPLLYFFTILTYKTNAEQRTRDDFQRIPANSMFVRSNYQIKLFQ